MEKIFKNVLESGRFKLGNNGCLEKDYEYNHFIIPEGVREIGENCFENECVFSVKMPDSVIKINGGAFSGYKGEKIILSENLEEIGERAFCVSELCEITVPGSVKTVCKDAFGSCINLEKAVLEEGVINIEKGAFIFCKNLKHIVFPSTLKKIGNEAFYGCESLERVELPEGLEEIGELAFSGCNNLKDVTVSKNTSVKSEAFYEYWKNRGYCGYCGELCKKNAFCENPDCTVNSTRPGWLKWYPSDRVKIMSREEMEKLLEGEFPKKTAVISFYDPVSKRTPKDYFPIDFGDKSNLVFSVGVHDIDIEILSDYGLTEETYLPEARELARFIIRAVNSNYDIICQCEYGQSRSAACAAAIIEFSRGEGIKIFSDYRYYPNQLVYHKILDALESVQEEVYGKKQCRRIGRSS